MKSEPMTAREVNGILEMLDFLRKSQAALETLAVGLKNLGQLEQARIAFSGSYQLDKAWQVAAGLLERGGWILGEGAETGVPMALPLAASPAEAAKAMEKAERGNTQQEPVTAPKKVVTAKKRSRR
jgi:hypothetical protein